MLPIKVSKLANPLPFTLSRLLSRNLCGVISSGVDKELFLKSGLMYIYKWVGNERNPKITLKNLREYYDSLNSILKKHILEHSSIIKK